MSAIFAAAIYFIIWWLVFIAVLPFGVKTQAEQGEVIPGTVESAPAAPAIFKKFIVTTIVSAIVFAGVYAVIVYRLIELDDIPFLPGFERLDQ